MPPELSNCGRWSWRVYDVVPDEAPRPWLDTDSLSHWFSSSYDCERGQVGRYERADLLSTAEASGWSLYLMLDVQHPRAGHGQVQPNAAAVVQLAAPTDPRRDLAGQRAREWLRANRYEVPR